MINEGFWEYFEVNGIQKEKVKGLLNESNKVVDYEREKLKTGRYWQISKDEVKAIYAVVKSRRPKIVVETGMGSGVSSTTILSALGSNGKLISIDPGLPYGKGDKEVGFIIPPELKKNLEWVKGTSSEKLASVLDSVGQVDIFFHDSDHSYENVTFELETVWPRLINNKIILVDNYDWSDAPKDFSYKNSLKLRNLADDLALISE